jgi:hypothetical protein
MQGITRTWALGSRGGGASQWYAGHNLGLFFKETFDSKEHFLNGKKQEVLEPLLIN